LDDNDKIAFLFRSHKENFYLFNSINREGMSIIK